jgi:hypothetical protein
VNKVSKKKGYTPPKPLAGDTGNIRRLEELPTITRRLERLLEEIVEHRLSPRCFGLFKKMAYIEPCYRLVMNLKIALSLICDKDVRSVLQGGLTPEEKAALIEVDMSGMSLESRRTAHSLLDLDGRAELIRTFGHDMRDLRTRKSQVLVKRALD